MSKRYSPGGFRWCPHCGKPHDLAERRCSVTGSELESVHERRLTDRAHPPLLGTVLDGKYRILRTIGSGGMGTVFEAENLALKRLVAVKVVSRPNAPEALARLALEAKLVAAIQHPNICDVYDVGQLPSGGPYVVLERLFGDTLATQMRGTRRPSLRAVVDIFVQVLSALHAAHLARILHRDLKPQNLFLAERLGCAPIVKIVDFGFAQQLSPFAVARITLPGKKCGTLAYMSPEQVRADRLDHRSDLFAIGVILYEMLTGRHPFAAASRVELMTNILRAEPRPLRQQRLDASPALEEIVMSAMNGDASRRPASAYEMLNALAASVPSASAAAVDADDDVSSLTSPMWIPPSASPAP